VLRRSVEPAVEGGHFCYAQSLGVAPSLPLQHWLGIQHGPHLAVRAFASTANGREHFKCRALSYLYLRRDGMLLTDKY
jgi:hypothetical protein